MGRANQPRDRRGRWTDTGAGSRLGSQRQDFARALQSQGRVGDNDGRSTVYAYLRDKDSPSGKAGSPYYVGVAGDVRRPYSPHGRTPVPTDERRIRMLRQNVTHEQAREWEKHYIQQFGRKDVGSGRGMLINRTDGGDGTVGARMSPRARAKISAAQQGKKLSDEQKAKIGAAQQGRTSSPETRAKISAANQGRVHSSESKAKIGAANQGRTHSAEARAKISDAARNRSPETRARLSTAARGMSAEVKAKAADTRARNNAIRHGVDPDIWARLPQSKRVSAVSGAKYNGMTVAQYIEKQRLKWGV